MTCNIYENIKTLSTIQPDHIRKYDRMDVVVRFMKAKAEDPEYKKNQLCALIGVSNSYLKRVMKDLDIKSFYRHDIPVNKKRVKKEKSVTHDLKDQPENVPKQKVLQTTKAVRKKPETAELTAKGAESSYDFDKTFAKTCEDLISR